MSNEQVLLESKTMREEMVVKVSDERADEMFKKVKSLVLLPDNTNVTTEMVANYFEVSEETIRQVIVRHNDELKSDGLKVLTGKELSYIKSLCQIESRAKSLTIIPRRAILRIGMLLRDSIIAKQIRTYLLDVENNTKTEDKLIALTQDNNNAILLLQDNIQSLKDNNSIIITDNEELKHNIHMLINKVDELLEQPLFKIHENSSRLYDMLVINDFLSAMESLGVKNTYSNNYTLFNKEFENWTGINFGNKKINKKQYWISYYGIENIRQFIVGIKQGIIVKNDNGFWVSKSGIYSNKVEWKKVLAEFDNKCAYCGSDEILLAEHIIPQSSEGGVDLLFNVIPACSHCNDRKKTMGMKQWLEIKKQEGMTKEQIQKIRDHWERYYIKLELDI